MDQQKGRLAFFRAQSTDAKDGFGLVTFNVIEATIKKKGSATPAGWQEAGWLPNRTVAEEWLSFVHQQHHPVLPLN